uniref:Uncharacterized protein n=1 Tax=Lotharella globosa TaxID=91324 RepID=A0A7S3YNA2_9EUKA
MASLRGRWCERESRGEEQGHDRRQFMEERNTLDRRSHLRRHLSFFLHVPCPVPWGRHTNYHELITLQQQQHQGEEDVVLILLQSLTTTMLILLISTCVMSTRVILPFARLDEDLYAHRPNPTHRDTVPGDPGH